MGKNLYALSLSEDRHYLQKYHIWNWKPQQYIYDKIKKISDKNTLKRIKEIEKQLTKLNKEMQDLAKKELKS